MRAHPLVLGRRKLTEEEGRLLKLLSGVMMCSLGLILLLQPELLSNLAATVGILVLAIAVTGIAHVIRRRMQSSHPQP